jgi:hypothetical protein
MTSRRLTAFFDAVFFAGFVAAFVVGFVTGFFKVFLGVGIMERGFFPLFRSWLRPRVGKIADPASF